MAITKPYTTATGTIEADTPYSLKVLTGLEAFLFPLRAKQPEPVGEVKSTAELVKELNEKLEAVDKVKEGGVEYVYEKTKEDYIPPPERRALYPREAGRIGVLPEIVSEKDGHYKTGITEVKTLSDAAHIATNIASEAQEHLISIITDKNDKVIGVYRHSIGGKATDDNHYAAAALRKRGTPEALAMADKLEREAQANGERLKEADGEITEKAVDEALAKQSISAK